MRNVRVLAAALLSTALLVGLFSATALAQPTRPYVVGGTVTVGGQPAAVGTIVRAMVAGQEVANTTTAANSEYLIQVDPTGRGFVSGTTVINFQIGGVVAAETATFDSEALPQNVNLTFAALPATGDVGLMALWCALAALGGVSLVGGTVILRRRPVAA